MSKVVKLKNAVVRFPPVCCLCLAPAPNTYLVEGSVDYGRRSKVIKLPVPLCEAHLAQAKHKGAAERLVEKAGVVAGIGAGLATGRLVWALQTVNGPGDLGLNICLAAFFGLAALGLVWGVIAFGLAPLLAEPETKAARQAVRIVEFVPSRAGLELVFVNETMADWVAKENGLSEAD